MNLLDDLCKKIVSPARIHYSMYDLGHPITPLYRRHDFTVYNESLNKLLVSYYEPKQKTDAVCVMYLHSMNGSRLESSLYAEMIVKMGLSFCNFDFTGCGNSEGEGISFGCNQKNDVKAVVEDIKNKFKIERFIFWGRSMGSVCVIKYCEMCIGSTASHTEDELNEIRLIVSTSHVLGIILDSTFKSFEQLAIEIAQRNSKLPLFLIKAGYLILKNTLEEKGKFKISELQLQKPIKLLRIPVLFLASETDRTVDCTHSKDLYSAYSHKKKQLFFINGLHNDTRDKQYIDRVQDFVLAMVRDFKVRQKIKRKQQMHVAQNQKMASFQNLNRLNQYYEPIPSRIYEQEVDRTKCQCSLFQGNKISKKTENNKKRLNEKEYLIRNASELYFEPIRTQQLIKTQRSTSIDRIEQTTRR